MYFNPAPDKQLRPFNTGLLNVGIAAMVIANIALGLFSERVVNLADKWSNALTVASQVANIR